MTQPEPENPDGIWWEVGWQAGLWVIEWGAVIAFFWFMPWQVLAFSGLIVGVLVLFRYLDRT